MKSSDPQFLSVTGLSTSLQQIPAMVNDTSKRKRHDEIDNEKLTPELTREKLRKVRARERPKIPPQGQPLSTLVQAADGVESRQGYDVVIFNQKFAKKFSAEAVKGSHAR
jgi:hypothetical protein